MEVYSTEEQQAEAIKGFFRDNGVALAVGVVLGLGGLYGWKAYNQHTIETTESLSDSNTKMRLSRIFARILIKILRMNSYSG